MIVFFSVALADVRSTSSVSLSEGDEDLETLHFCVTLSFCVEINFALRKIKNWGMQFVICHSCLTILDLGVQMGYLDQSEIPGAIQDSTRKNLSQNPILRMKILTG